MSRGVFYIRVTNAASLPPIDPDDDHLLCLVFERAVSLFNPAAVYTGDFVSPWTPLECAGELYDTFQLQGLTFSGNRDGILEGGFGATRNNGYNLYSFPNDGAAFLYHVGLFSKNDLTTEIVNINSASLQGSSTPYKTGAQCGSQNTNGYCTLNALTHTPCLPACTHPIPLNVQERWR